MIKIYDSSGTEKTKPAGWDDLVAAQPVQLLSSLTLLTVPVTNIVAIAEEFAVATQEQRWADKVANAIAGGMSSSAVGPTGEVYQFSTGFNVYKKASNSVGYAITVNASKPTLQRDILFLGSSCIGYDFDTANTLTIYDQCTDCIPCATYDLLIDCTWCIFHEVNQNLHDIFSFTPTANPYAIGTLASYQGMLAKWNQYVWTDTFVFEVGAKGVETTFLCGYKNPSCTSNITSIELVLTKTTLGNVYERLLQVLRNGELTNTAGGQTITIRRCNGSTCTTETGTGTENINKTDTYIWDNYKITINMGSTANYSMGSYYVAAFAIALSGEYRESLQPISESTYITMSLTATWYNGASVVMTKTGTMQLLALQEYEPNIPEEA